MLWFKCVLHRFSEYSATFSSINTMSSCHYVLRKVSCSKLQFRVQNGKLFIAKWQNFRKWSMQNDQHLKFDYWTSQNWRKLSWYWPFSQRCGCQNCVDVQKAWFYCTSQAIGVSFKDNWPNWQSCREESRAGPGIISSEKWETNLKRVLMCGCLFHAVTELRKRIVTHFIIISNLNIF